MARRCREQKNTPAPLSSRGRHPQTCPQVASVGGGCCRAGLWPKVGSPCSPVRSSLLVLSPQTNLGSLSCATNPHVDDDSCIEELKDELVVSVLDKSRKIRLQFSAQERTTRRRVCAGSWGANPQVPSWFLDSCLAAGSKLFATATTEDDRSQASSVRLTWVRHDNKGGRYNCRCRTYRILCPQFVRYLCCVPCRKAPSFQFQSRQTGQPLPASFCPTPQGRGAHRPASEWVTKWRPGDQCSLREQPIH